MKRFLLLSLMLISCFLISGNQLNAQKVHAYDSSYFEVFPHTLTARVYGIHKYSQLVIPSNDNSQDIKYTPNTKFSLGVGATYNNFTLNAAFGFGFLNNDDEKGKTKSFNLQIHAYPYKWTVDLLTVFHKGEYILPKDFNAAGANSYYYRPDVKANVVGLAAYHIANATRFSYRAAWSQNEWQKKSAGTLLYGGGAYYGSLKGDSSLIPFSSTNSFKQAGIDKITLITVGPGIGYAYTLVAAQHIFLMGSVIGNLDINFAKEYKNGSNETKTSVSPNAVYKASVGYNSASWAVVGGWAGTAFLFKGAASSKSYFLPTGLFTVAVTKKIFLK